MDEIRIIGLSKLNVIQIKITDTKILSAAGRVGDIPPGTPAASGGVTVIWLTRRIVMVGTRLKSPGG